MSKADTYRWLEKDSKRTQQWIRAQEEQTNKYFRDTQSRNILKKRFKNLLDVDVELIPVVRDGQYFFRRRKKGEDQASLFLKHGLKGKPVLLINPNTLRFGKIQNWCVSKDAKYIAVDFSLVSNDRYVIKIFDVAKKKFLKDTITSDGYPRFNAWHVSSNGFWYSKGEKGHSIAEEKYFKRIYYHILGRLIEEDELFFGKDLVKEDYPSIKCSHDGRYEIVTVHHALKTTTIYFRDTQNSESKFINITGNIKALSYAKAEDDYIYLFTDHKAPNSKILRRKILKNFLGKWQVFVPELKFKLEDYILLKNYLLIEYIENVSSSIYLLNLKSGKRKNIKLPSCGSMGGYSNEYNDRELFFSFSSLNVPSSIYRLDLRTLGKKLYWRSKINLSSAMSLKQEWVISKDGIRIPFFILKNKDNNQISPTLVYAYGGFGFSLLPGFRSSVIPFVENGGIFVLANIRGGGEFGKEWHEAIIKNKQHKRFEDFAAILKHLVDQKYTIPEKLGIWGGSNGGLLMSVMALRYPNLFRVALIDVPVTDMLRFQHFHGGRYWFYDYRNPDDKKMRKYLLTYSPYHNVGNENYPAMMIMTAEHDDRVHPMHSYKLFAALKANKKQNNTLLLKIERQAGHGGSGKLEVTINKLADMFYFLCKELGIKV